MPVIEFELRSKDVNEVRTLIEAGIVPVMELPCNPNLVTNNDVSHVTPVHLHQPSVPSDFVGDKYPFSHQGSVTSSFNFDKLLAIAHNATP